MAGELVGKAPQEPTRGARTPELKIVEVEVSEYKSGIPLKGFTSVVEALHTFASGRTKSGRVTQDDLLGSAERQGGFMGVGLVLLTSSGVDKNKFVTDMLSKAEHAIKEQGRWQRHFDYDGMGTSFFKTTVDIAMLPDVEDGYLLGLNAAYVGKEVEDGLAETLGIEQGLTWKAVRAVLEPEGDQFSVDFDGLAKSLQGVYTELNPGTTEELTGDRMLDAILGTGRYGDEGNPFVLGIKDGIIVSVSLGRVGNRFNWKNGERGNDQWRRQRSVLSGALAKSYKDEGGMEPPSIIVDIRRYSEDRYNAAPAIDPVMKARINEIASKVATAFNHQ